MTGRPNGYFRIGKCLRCGECCRNVVLSIKGERIRTEQQFAQLVAQDPPYMIFVPKLIVSGGIILFDCSKLAGNNVCTIYRERPRVCMDYPDPDLLKCGTDVIEGCGFYLVPPLDSGDLPEK